MIFVCVKTVPVSLMRVLYLLVEELRGPSNISGYAQCSLFMFVGSTHPEVFLKVAILVNPVKNNSGWVLLAGIS